MKVGDALASFPRPPQPFSLHEKIWDTEWGFMLPVNTQYKNVMFFPGVFFSLKGSYISTNSNIFITDIGEGNCEALLCYTDLNECCHDSNTTTRALGQWFYPNGSNVRIRSSGQDFYIDRGPSVVRLNRRTDATSITGLFCCEVPDATSTKTRICTSVIG